MSNNQVVIRTLVEKRNNLVNEQKKMWDQYQKQIDEIEDALDLIAGKKVWRVEPRETYDDELPGYISNTEDGI